MNTSGSAPKCPRTPVQVQDTQVTWQPAPDATGVGKHMAGTAFRLN